MTEDFKKWLCNLVYGNEPYPDNAYENDDLETLIKAMWELDKRYCNGKVDYHIKEYTLEHGYQIVYYDKHDGKLKPSNVNFIKYDVDDFNSRLNALKTALEYIYKETHGEKS